MSSSSSGHSSDERWYDFMDQPPSTDNSPPPLPTRIGSKASAFQKVSNIGIGGPPARKDSEKSNDTSPLSLTTSVITSQESQVQVQQQQQQGYKYSTNTPVTMSNNNAPAHRVYNGYESASSSDTVKSSSTIHITPVSSDTMTVLQEERRIQEDRRTTVQEERRSSEARSTYLTDYELNNNRSSVESDVIKPDNQTKHNDNNFLQHNRLSALKTSPIQHQHHQQATYSNVVEATSEQERLGGGVTGVRSEDELSGVSSHSPHRPRQGGRRNTTGTTTPSSTTSVTSASSRGQSPRTVSEVAAKKKVARSARNSANLAQSTLQEDLMKLISPDYDPDANANKDTVSGHNLHDSPLSKLPKKTLSELSLMKSRSRENIARLEDNVSAEVSFHMARPATVISNNSTTASPASANTSGLSQSEKSINSNNSAPQNKNKIPQEAGNMNIEWTSLVDTATKAINEDPVNSNNNNNDNNVNDDEQKPQTHTRNINVNGGVNEEDAKALRDRVAALEDELRTERRGKVDLEQQIEQLKEENVRLKEESQTAAQQLRRFTEWFFQTIDKT